MIPQVIYVLLALVNLFLVAYLHGKPKTVTWNFWSGFITTILMSALLYWGGFFNVWVD